MRFSHLFLAFLWLSVAVSQWLTHRLALLIPTTLPFNLPRIQGHPAFQRKMANISDAIEGNDECLA